jgi:hypothetical protein
MDGSWVAGQEAGHEAGRGVCAEKMFLARSIIRQQNAVVADFVHRLDDTDLPFVGACVCDFGYATHVPRLCRLRGWSATLRRDNVGVTSVGRKFSANIGRERVPAPPWLQKTIIEL